MIGLTSPAIRAVRARFGDDADAVLELRAANLTVRPFGDRFAVDEEVVDSAELRRLADAAKARREARERRAKQKAAPSIERINELPARSENAQARGSEGTAEITSGPGIAPATLPEVEMVPAGEAAGNAGGSHDAGLTPAPEVARAAPPAIGLCGCGRPKKGHHGKCWFRRGWPGPNTEPRKRVRAFGTRLTEAATRITALECEVNALKSAVERMRMHLAMEHGR